MIIVRNRELLIPNNERCLGSAYDNYTDTRIFQIDRDMMNDISDLTFRLDIEAGTRVYKSVSVSTTITGGAVIISKSAYLAVYPPAATRVFTFDGDDWQTLGAAVDLDRIGITITSGAPASGDTITVVVTESSVTGDTVILTKEVTPRHIRLLWTITEATLASPGTAFIQIRATDAMMATRWSSAKASVYILENIATPGVYPAAITELEQMEQDLANLTNEVRRATDLTASTSRSKDSGIHVAKSIRNNVINLDFQFPEALQPGAGQSNRNILRNPWFTINQRGATEYAVSGYTVDAWKMSYGNRQKVRKTQDGISMIRTAVDYENPATVNVIQPIYDPIRAGMTYTLSIIYKHNRTLTHEGSSNYYARLMGDGGQVLSISLPQTSEYTLLTRSVTLKADVENPYVRIADYGDLYETSSVGDQLDIKAIKLEVGAGETLSNDDAPEYIEELRRCQRRFYRLAYKVAAGYGIATLLARSSTAARGTLDLPVEMEGTPTMAISDISDLSASGAGNGAGATGITDLSMYSMKQNHVLLDATFTTAVAFHTYMLTLNNAAAYIDFSSEDT